MEADIGTICVSREGEQGGMRRPAPPGPSRAARGRGHLEAAGDVDAGQRGVPALHQPQLHHEINID